MNSRLTLKQGRMALPRRRRRSGCRAAVFLVEAKQHREEKDRAEEETAAGQEHRGQEAEAETLKSVSLGVLPQDLAIEVLKRVPLRSLLQMRVLSTSFNAFLRSPPFPQPGPLLITVKVSNAGPGPDMRAPRELIAYCPHLNTSFPLPGWHSGLLSAMGGPGLLQVPSVQYSHLSPILSSLAMASAGGLMCTVVTALRPEAERQQAPPPPELDPDVDDYLSQYVFNYKDFHLLVFNFFTGASKRLPPPPQHYSSFLGNNLFVHMFLDASAPGAYYVVLHYSECGALRWPSYRALSIYSSRTGCWMDGHATNAGPYPCTFGDIRKCDLFSYHHNQLCSGTLVAYAIHSDSWLSIPNIPVEEPGVWDYVFKWQGRVFLASSQMADVGFKVCVLTSSSRWSNSASWVEVARTPASLVQSVNINIMTLDVKFVLCGNLVCLTGSYSGTVGYHRNYLRPLVYDLAGDSWYHLPPPCIKGTMSDLGVGLLAFQPHLQATP